VWAQAWGARRRRGLWRRHRRRFSCWLSHLRAAAVCSFSLAEPALGESGGGCATGAAAGVISLNVAVTTERRGVTASGEL
jgi:hypothetical protein